LVSEEVYSRESRAEEAVAVSTDTPAASGLSADAELALGWFKEHYYGGRAPVYSVQELARGMFGRTEGPAPGSTFDPATWGRVRQAIFELEGRGLIAQGRLPQGDFGYRLVT
jgi:hypothetical protein